jgi:hypothetical protein
MKKFRLFSEFNDVAIYGEDAKDAVLRHKTFKRPKHQDGEKAYGNRMIANLVDSKPLEVAKFIGIEDTSNVSRGDKKFIGVLVEDTEGRIERIDMVEESVKII